MLLDAALGEPKWLWSRVPHPAVLMGRAIAWCDDRFNSGQMRLAKGILVMLSLSIAAIIAGCAFSLLGPVAEIGVAAVLLAQRSLAQHVQAVEKALRISLGDGRRAVAMIVGRDTSQMDAPAVSRAAIESAAENLSDGVIAPAFWFLVGGLPGLLVYKITNTADSMIGHRTTRHAQFGWAAARLDDLLNLVPARLTALLIACTHHSLRDWRAIANDARMHRSPNAGWPEAAMARALNVALSGPRSYHGQLQTFPWVHEQGSPNPGPTEIGAAVSALWKAWGLALGVVLLLGIVALVL
ncbi:adenosylcobinamide-phosphate synthase CbiB [Thalassovita sp.]|uniref:adenosylcobinamide-phosphate synthase CbiB n=1 Tax=Thalassovita sp. TaxID=1979401 RepID=UPI0029DE62E5|nr:adenosylcobinamide-phosphate synthase CbiB [Thalassovita sp.]